MPQILPMALNLGLQDIVYFANDAQLIVIDAQNG
jgi:hypothetical protein